MTDPWDGIFTYIYLMCYGFHVGKYTVRPMDPSWAIVPGPFANLTYHHLTNHLDVPLEVRIKG